MWSYSFSGITALCGRDYSFPALRPFVGLSLLQDVVPGWSILSFSFPILDIQYREIWWNAIDSTCFWSQVAIHLWNLQELLSLENHLHKFISETLLFVFVPCFTNLEFEILKIILETFNKPCTCSKRVNFLEKP